LSWLISLPSGDSSLPCCFLSLFGGHVLGAGFAALGTALAAQGNSVRVFGGIDRPGSFGWLLGCGLFDHGCGKLVDIKRLVSA